MTKLGLAGIAVVELLAGAAAVTVQGRAAGADMPPAGQGRAVLYWRHPDNAADFSPAARKTPDGREAHEIAGEGPTAEAEAIGRRAGEAVRAKAGARFFEAWS